MLTLKGTAVNIHKPIIGRVSFSQVEKEDRSKTIVLNPDSAVQELSENAAIIFSNSSAIKANNVALIFDVDCANSLDEGDVVEIQPSGRIEVIYQRKSLHNQIFATSKCNSNCVMCPQPINIPEEDRTESNLRLISLIDRTTQELAFNGGEPTLLGPDLFRLILACKHFLPETSILLLTNARRFKDFDYTHVFSSICHPSITISTSLYGDNEIEHDYIVGSKGAFNESILGMLNLATFDNQIEVRIVIHKYTYKNLTGIAEYIYRNLTFVGHIAFMGMETIWQAKKNLNALWVEPDAFILVLKKAIHLLRQRRMSVSIYNMPLCLLPRELWQFARRSISDWKNVFDTDCIYACSVKNQCAGMFNSGVKTYKQYLKPIL